MERKGKRIIHGILDQRDNIFTLLETPERLPLDELEIFHLGKEVSWEEGMSLIGQHVHAEVVKGRYGENRIIKIEEIKKITLQEPQPKNPLQKFLGRFKG